MTELTPQEHARRLNMCLEAGLTVAYRSNPKYKGLPANWTDVPFERWGCFIDPTRTEIYDFLVLRPGETVDNFVIED